MGNNFSVRVPQWTEPRLQFRQGWEVIPEESEVLFLHRISAIVSSKRLLDEMLGEVIGFTIQATACDACLV